jgi:solute carrier family 35 protein E1
VGVVSATEVNFAWAGFVAAMISNFAFVFRNIKSKEAQADIGLQGINLCVLASAACWLAALTRRLLACSYAWMSILGTVVLLPFTLLMEGGAISTALSTASAKFATSGAVPFLWFGAGSTFVPFLLWGGLFYHLYNQTSYMALTGISPLTYSICNTVKRCASFYQHAFSLGCLLAHAASAARMAP